MSNYSIRNQFSINTDTDIHAPRSFIETAKRYKKSDKLSGPLVNQRLKPNFK